MIKNATEQQPMLIPVILSGGAGTRLWPLSRELYPKQFLPLTGERTLLQETVARLDGLDRLLGKVAAPIVVCNEEHRFLVAEQLRTLGVAPGEILLEPAGRNTAPALTLAALSALRAGQDGVLFAMPADHVVKDTAAFQEAVAKAASLAEQGRLVTFGIVPTAPETGYGYIQTGAQLRSAPAPRAGESAGGGNQGTGLREQEPPLPSGERAGVRGEAFTIARFVEKPGAETAAQYLASGDYYWNSGMFMMQAGVWLEAIGRFRPDILEACRQAHALGRSDSDFFRVDRSAFANCPSDSIDYAVMERLVSPFAGGGYAPSPSPLGGEGGGEGNAFHAAVIPLDAAWSDVGAWPALWEIQDKDAEGNVTRGDVLTHHARNSMIVAQDRLVAAIGVDDLVIVETADAVLVASKAAAQDVKAIASTLKTQGRQEHAIHRRVHRPWGSYEGIDFGSRYQVKRITVNPGASLSLQMHYHRAEHWVVVRGTAKVTRGDETLVVTENQSTYIPLGVKHRLENPGAIPLEMIEVQSGSYLGEDDIVRFEDNYGRGNGK